MSLYYLAGATMANLMSTMQELNEMTNYNYTQTPHVNRTLSLVYQTYTQIYQFEICVHREIQTQNSPQ